MTTKVSAKIGLPYLSDYVFGASSTVWTKNTGSSQINKDVNWMYTGNSEWTITRCADNSTQVFMIQWNGGAECLSAGYFHSMYDHDVRPTFYLNSSVTYKSGSGSSTDPMRLG